MRRLASLTLAGAFATALTISGCTGPVAEETIPPDVGAGDPGADDAPDGGPGGVAEDIAPSPAPGTCVDVPESPDGVYLVADAGNAVVTVEDGRLVVGDVDPAEGWTHEVSEADDDEVEIEFRGDGRELDLEVELDDGQVSVQVCADDD